MPENIVCDICGFVAKNKMSLLGHLKKHNPKRNETQRNATQNGVLNADPNAFQNAERNAFETETKRNGNETETAFQTQRNETERNATQRNGNAFETKSERSGNAFETQRNETQRNETERNETQRNGNETETERNETQQNGTQNATVFVGNGTHQTIDPQVLNMIEYQLGEKIDLSRRQQNAPKQEVVYYDAPSQNAPQVQNAGNSKVLEYVGLTVANLAQELIRSRLAPKQGPSIFEELGRQSFSSFLSSFSKSRGTAMGKTLPGGKSQDDEDPYEEMNTKIANTIGKYFEEQDKKFKQLTEYNERLLKMQEKEAEKEAENAKVDPDVVNDEEQENKEHMEHD